MLQNIITNPCHIDDVFISFLGKDSIQYRHGEKALGLNLKYLKLCSEDERRSYGLGTT